MRDDLELLQKYHLRGDESAFNDLVARHLNHAYAAALRQTRGVPHHAEEVVQAVFTDLARKAGQVAGLVANGHPLVGWLHTGIRFAAANLRRSEERRQLREHTAHVMSAQDQNGAENTQAVLGELKSILDEVLASLPPADRDAVMLRYFEGKELREVGGALGLSEEAARKRVTRAMERLRLALVARGITTTISVLAGMLEQHAVQTAPAGLAATLAVACLKGVSLSPRNITPPNWIQASAALKVMLGGAALLVIAAGLSHQFHRGATQPPRPEVSIWRQGVAIADVLKRGDNRPTMAEDPLLANVRSALRAPYNGLVLMVSPEMKRALIQLKERYPEAVPILREYLNDPNIEIRQRVLASMRYVGAAAADAVPDLIEKLQRTEGRMEAFYVTSVLEAIGVGLDEKPALRKTLAALRTQWPGFSMPPSYEEDEQTPEEVSKNHEHIFQVALAAIRPGNEKDHLFGLAKLTHLGPEIFKAIPDLRSFVREPHPLEVRQFAERLLTEIDPEYPALRQSWPEYQTEQGRVQELTEKMRKGQASVPEMTIALQELPAAIPEIARTLGEIGYAEMRRRGEDDPTVQLEFADALRALEQIANGDHPEAARLAASEAFRQLQPMRPKLLYTTEETGPALEELKGLLTSLPAEKRSAIEATLTNLNEVARIKSSPSRESGQSALVYPGEELANLAHMLRSQDPNLQAGFVAAMRRADPKFLRQF